MQLAIRTVTIFLIGLSSASVNAIAARKTEFLQDFDYCGEIVNPFTGTSQCVCINQLNEALVHTRFQGLEPLFDRAVRDGPACTPTALPSSSSDFDFSFPTTDSTSSPITSPATATSTDDVDGAGDEPEFDLDLPNYTPSEISDVPYHHRNQMDDEDEYGGLDFSLRALADD